MDIRKLKTTTQEKLIKWPVKKLIEAIKFLQKQYHEIERENKALRDENKRLKEEIEKQKKEEINKRANQPSSKKAEWEEKGVGNDGKGKKKGRGKKGRKGAGNKKKECKVSRETKATVQGCEICGKDLRGEKALKSVNKRVIEDIPEARLEAEVILIKQEKKYCDECKQVITARSELALPKSDIGINATILIGYLWVAISLPLTKISSYLRTFYGLRITTSGLSRHVIRLSEIMKPVYEEIVKEIKEGIRLHADETGWRVKGKNWWLWVFGTEDTAYFTVDKSRGSKVVRRVLGEIFMGVLIVDGWKAYLSLICEQQSCMAHLLRKIRHFYTAYPHLVEIAKFYIKLRRIIRDGEKLQKVRKEIGEEVFQRRLKRLKKRLEELLEWSNPDEVLKDIIEKVRRQQPRILTFVEHEGVPCHNNFAEYLIRIGVLKRKISGGSLSAEGANAYAVLLSVYVTCKLRGISFPVFMKESLKQYIKTGKPMLLKSFGEPVKFDLAA